MPDDLTKSHYRVLVVGMGRIARIHHEVLATRTDVEIVGGVDPARELPGVAPVFRTLDEALAADLRPDLVVLATPTRTHVALAEQALSSTDARVLSEKPLAECAEDVARLADRFGRDELARRLKVAHHFAFSPEVEWARDLVGSRPEWGRPTRMLCVFHDPYGARTAGELEAYVSSWVDSGPNQLSVLSAFAEGWAVITHEGTRDRAVTVLDHDGGTTTLVSNWLAGDSSKQTVLEYQGGEVVVRIDHTSMTGLVLEGGAVTSHLGYTGSASRKVAHYAGLYRALLTDPDDERLGVAVAERIARVLAAAAG